MSTGMLVMTMIYKSIITVVHTCLLFRLSSRAYSEMHRFKASKFTITTLRSLYCSTPDIYLFYYRFPCLLNLGFRLSHFVTMYTYAVWTQTNIIKLHPLLTHATWMSQVILSLGQVLTTDIYVKIMFCASNACKQQLCTMMQYRLFKPDLLAPCKEIRRIHPIVEPRDICHECMLLDAGWPRHFGYHVFNTWQTYVIWVVTRIREHNPHSCIATARCAA